MVDTAAVAFDGNYVVGHGETHERFLFDYHTRAEYLVLNKIRKNAKERLENAPAVVVLDLSTRIEFTQNYNKRVTTQDLCMDEAMRKATNALRLLKLPSCTLPVVACDAS